MTLVDLGQELRELGVGPAWFRLRWELRSRLKSAVAAGHTLSAAPTGGAETPDYGWTRILPFGDAPSVAAAVLLDDAEHARLFEVADEACVGRILAFGRWYVNYGRPIQWHTHPLTGHRYVGAQAGHGSAAGGDVKVLWEAARFPHAYYLARAASRADAPQSDRWAGALLDQITEFETANPAGVGIHWASGQETAIRLLAWVFAYDALLARTSLRDDAAAVIARGLAVGAACIEENFDYSRRAVYNNHLLAEALGLFLVGSLCPSLPRAPHWRALGRAILDEQANKQFYEDGGYLQQSHNYHRVVLQHLIWASTLATSCGSRPSGEWLGALERSLDFLVAHQNPEDGRLPNYGSNDGSYPGALSSCDFSDFRPVLQTVSLLTRGERIYDVGPWDEEAAWMLGSRVLDAPLNKPGRVSVAFRPTGFHILRGRAESSFATFRCGSIRERFSQIDMLHVDVWWRGQNVLVDAGSFAYNGAPEWHNHFMRTASHNTVTVDGCDQMLHFRQFKMLYWTRAALLEFEDQPEWALCAGEHYGYRRRGGDVVHCRSMLFIKDDTWIVADHITGSGSRELHVHWLAGDYPHEHDAAAGRLDLDTQAGPFSVSVLNVDGTAAPTTVARGQQGPPRGWLSRYYGVRVAVPSLAMEQTRALPSTTISVLSGQPWQARVDGARWTVDLQDGEASFALSDGRFRDVVVSGRA